MNMVEIIVPATTANMGPGFDCLGMALNLYNKVRFEETEKDLIIQGCEGKYENENNLIYKSMVTTFQKIGYKYEGIKITVDSNIPVSRGLGSSAACILAGIMGANEIANGQLTKLEILKIATEIEGHPDNIAPALFGGMTVSLYDNGEVYFNKIPFNSAVDFYALIPSFTLSTSESRSVLPKQVSFKDATYNVGRTALMIAAFVNGDLDLLNVATKDRLHQNYRGSLISEYDIIMGKLNNLQIRGSFLSGAGPTIIAVADKNNTVLETNIKETITGLRNNWTLKKLSIENRGAIVRKE